MLYLSRADMEKVFSMKDAFDSVQKAFEIYTAGGSNVPLRTVIRSGEAEGAGLFMPAIAGDAFGIKIVATFPNNPKLGKPTTPATMIVMNAVSGEVAAVMDGTHLTNMRTAAGAGLAAKLLARKDSKIGALIGLGGQAQCQLEAMLEACPTIEEVRVFDVSEERKASFAKDNMHLAKMVPVASGDEAVTGADVITTATTSKGNVFSAENIKKGAHVAGIGSFTPEMHELPEGVVAGCDLLVFDTADGVLSEAGDILTPKAKGLLDDKDLTIEMGHLIAGKVGRKSDDEITLYKGVGSGVMDIVAANEIYKKAIEMGIGVKLG